MDSELTMRDFAMFLGCNVIVYPQFHPGFMTKLSVSDLFIKENKKLVLKKLEDITENDVIKLLNPERYLFPKIFEITKSKVYFTYQSKANSKRRLGIIHFYHLTITQFKYLLENYYDLFGWIDRGLALREKDVLVNIQNQNQ
jgi:hypothetical protein